MTHAWYVVGTTPVHRIEFAVMHALNQRELAAMVPFEKKAIKVKGKRHLKWVAFPLFPRYVFVQLPMRKVAYEFHWMRKYVDGVVGLLSRSRRGFEPLTLSQEDVDELRRLSDEGWRDEITEINFHKAFQRGTGVQILKGPLAGMTGKVDSIDRKRIGVMLQMLGSMRIVDLEAADLAVV